MEKLRPHGETETTWRNCETTWRNCETTWRNCETTWRNCETTEHVHHTTPKQTMPQLEGGTTIGVGSNHAGILVRKIKIQFATHTIFANKNIRNTNSKQANAQMIHIRNTYRIFLLSINHHRSYGYFMNIHNRMVARVFGF